MEELIKAISQKFGVNEETAREVAQVILGFAQRQLAAAGRGDLLSRFGGFGEGAQAQPETPKTPGFASLFGTAADAAKSFAELRALGIEGSQIGELIRTFLDKAREVVGPETVDEIVSMLPALRSYADLRH